MNQLLQNRYNDLGSDEIFQLRHKLADSPRALLLLDLLEKRRDKKINISDAVDFIYKNESENFETLRNRFFKLRKQVIGYIADNGGTKTTGGFTLLPLEETLYKSRQLISENHFQLAKVELKQLITECRRLNIFELLPDALSLLTYCNMAMNVLKENDKLLDEISDASLLLNDLRHAQASSRKIYQCVLSKQYAAIPSILRQLRRLAIVRAGFPRFRLLYHFTVVGYTIGIPGFSTRAHARHLGALKKLIAGYPGMPAGYYEPNAATLMQFYLLMAEGNHLFMKGDVAASYNYFRESWEIMERTPNLRIRKADSYFSNRIAIEIATGRFREALKTAEDLIEFQKEQRQEEKRLKGYAEMAAIYSYSFPSMKCPNPDFLMSQLKSYVSILRKNESPLLGDGLSTLAIFCFMNGEWKAANKLMQEEATQTIFKKMNLDIYNKVLIMTPATPADKIAELKIVIEKQLHKAVSTDMVFAIRRALNLLLFLEENRKQAAKK
jgi:tetratricopeptide (TPR) repeat protein